ncbi:MAG: NAD(P)-binding domain-containing protein [Hyphomonadaceae bacterium]|nr:NAD(P)-binding domain-containing protein [Hyphomonadaceae bacterium]
MRIAIIGVGNVGGALARGWARAGHDIVLGVRDPAKHQALIGETNATALSPKGAAATADVIVLALPWQVAEVAVRELGDLGGRPVMDCMNPLQFKDGVLSLDRGFSTSGAEALAEWVQDGRVVKAMNQVGAEMMQSAGSLSAKPVMFIAGDDDMAKRAISALVADLGFEVMDAGALAQARILEPLAMVWINQALFRGAGRNWALSIART